ncbi:hypothetical protein BDU57DRAFT_509933, partial [Ampelomyces quisqualis]
MLPQSLFFAVILPATRWLVASSNKVASVANVANFAHVTVSLYFSDYVIVSKIENI